MTPSTMGCRRELGEWSSITRISPARRGAASSRRLPAMASGRDASGSTHRLLKHRSISWSASSNASARCPTPSDCASWHAASPASCCRPTRCAPCASSSRPPPPRDSSRWSGYPSNARGHHQRRSRSNQLAACSSPRRRWNCRAGKTPSVSGRNMRRTWCSTGGLASLLTSSTVRCGDSLRASRAAWRAPSARMEPGAHVLVPAAVARTHPGVRPDTHDRPSRLAAHRDQLRAPHPRRNARGSLRPGRYGCDGAGGAPSISNMRSSR
jgi:hypothetical protein